LYSRGIWKVLEKTQKSTTTGRTLVIFADFFKIQEIPKITKVLPVVVDF
jgi:hypothetical protein